MVLAVVASSMFLLFNKWLSDFHMVFMICFGSFAVLAVICALAEIDIKGTIEKKRRELK
jgi:hypothetical protein